MSSIEERLGAGTAAARPAAAEGPAGIGGWLLLVAFGLLVGTFALPVSLAYQLFDPENQQLFKEYPLAMYGELALNVAMIVFGLVATLLFFRKSRYFPRVFIMVCIAGALAPMLGLAWIAFAFSSQLGRPIGEFLEVEQREIYRFVLGVISAVIWIAYTLRSKRVRNTFILGLSAQDVRGGASTRTRATDTLLLNVVVGAVIVLGMIAILAGVGHAIGRGVFSGQLVGGALQIALAVWLYRGSNAARIILGVLFGFGLVAFPFIAFFPGQSVTSTIFLLMLALMSAAAIWILFFSKRFAAELEINAAKYRKPDSETGSET